MTGGIRSDGLLSPDVLLDVGGLQAELFAELTGESLVVGFAGLEPTSGSQPDGLVRKFAMQQKESVRRVQEEASGGGAEVHRPRGFGVVGGPCDRSSCTNDGRALGAKMLSEARSSSRVHQR
jgi:hypothetical protein